MEVFEIHITGNSDINKELDNLGLKNIIVELLTPNHEVLRIEYMSSFIYKCNSYQMCKEYVDSLLTKLTSDIHRVKIESPYYSHYHNDSIYIESHFKPTNHVYPVSRNKRSGKIMSTDRSYDKDEYQELLHQWVKEVVTNKPHKRLKKSKVKKDSNVVDFVELLKKSIQMKNAKHKAKSTAK